MLISENGCPCEPNQLVHAHAGRTQGKSTWIVKSQKLITLATSAKMV